MINAQTDLAILRPFLSVYLIIIDLFVLFLFPHLLGRHVTRGSLDSSRRNKTWYSRNAERGKRGRRRRSTSPEIFHNQAEAEKRLVRIGYIYVNGRKRSLGLQTLAIRFTSPERSPNCLNSTRSSHSSITFRRE